MEGYKTKKNAGKYFEVKKALGGNRTIFLNILQSTYQGYQQLHIRNCDHILEKCT